ncbi:hypothetical protein OG967_48595 [Streptomyces phaeochromogenes]
MVITERGDAEQTRPDRRRHAPPTCLPAIRFTCITDPTRQHAFFYATATEAFARMLAAYARDDALNLQICVRQRVQSVQETA